MVCIPGPVRKRHEKTSKIAAAVTPLLQPPVKCVVVAGHSSEFIRKRAAGKSTRNLKSGSLGRLSLDIRIPPINKNTAYILYMAALFTVGTSFSNPSALNILARVENHRVLGSDT